ncbi:MAG: endonuclease [Candidatus Scalindua rubra]|uniref:Endonuclease n=1 Tax=Candidatus Scalindua rubra TaxID=1872076 RepID=A0A1E3XFN1_9BACT|nr:MAG: endonuclease [Candidatus Scalindua rubra]
MKKLLFGTAGIPHSSLDDSSIEGIKQVKKLGLNCMELEFVQGVRVKEKMALEITKAAKEKGIILSVHAPYFINFNSPEKRKVDASKHRLLQSARIGHLCGAISVAFHPGFYMGKEKTVVYKIIKKEIQQVIEILKGEGNSIFIRPEVTGKMSSFGGLGEVLRLNRDIENVLPCVDFAHLHARTGKYNSYEEFCRVLRLIEDKLGKAALQEMHIHVAGIQYGPKGERRHLNLGESDLNHSDLLRALKDFDVKGIIICESPNLEEDALLLQKEYKSISKIKRSDNKKISRLH